MHVATRYATHQKVEFKCRKLHSQNKSGVSFYTRYLIMNSGYFYYITDQYFIDFPDEKLMKNKETILGQAHDRPCFFAFQDSSTTLYWMIPFSSQIAKYRSYYTQKLQLYHRCDTIVFGNVLGHEKAFLIQNMCPVTPKYIKNQYMDRLSNLPVKIDGKLEKTLITKAKKVLALYRKGFPLIFPDILKIEAALLAQNLQTPP